jgi:hypothetical protein
MTLRTVVARGSPDTLLQDHHRSAAARPDSAQSADRGKSWMGCSPDDRPWHASLYPDPLIRKPTVETTSAGLFAHQRAGTPATTSLLGGCWRVTKRTQRRRRLTATCCTDRRNGGSKPISFWIQAMQTEIGWPKSSMRFNTWTATAASVARRWSVRAYSPSPITCL